MGQYDLYDSDEEEEDWDDSDEEEEEELPFHEENADQKARFAKVMDELRIIRESVEKQDVSSWAGDQNYKDPQDYLGLGDSNSGKFSEFTSLASDLDGGIKRGRRGAIKKRNSLSISSVDTQSDSGNGSGSSSSDSDKDNISVSSQDSDSQSNPTPPIAKARSEASLQQNQDNGFTSFAPTPLPRQEKARPIAVPRARSRQVEPSDFGDFTFWGDKNPKPQKSEYLKPVQVKQENNDPIYEEINYFDMDSPDFVGQDQEIPPSPLPRIYDPNTVNEMIQDQMHRMDVNDRGEAEDIFGDPLALADQESAGEKKPVPAPRNQEKTTQQEERWNLSLQSLQSLTKLAKEMKNRRISPDNTPVAAQRSTASLDQGDPQSQSGSQENLASLRDSGNKSSLSDNKRSEDGKKKRILPAPPKNTSSLFEDKTQSPTPLPRPISSLGVANGGVERGI